MDPIFGSPKTPPPGWIIFNGQLEPDTSVAGYFARGREVRGVCHTQDCRRRCHIDFGMLMERGLGRLSAGQIKRLLGCHRLDGCAMEFEERGGAEILLSSLVRKAHVAVRISCGRCGKTSIAHAESVIARLKAEGTGGAGTPVARLPELIRGACPKCGEKAWKAEVLWQDPDHLPAWYRRALEGGQGASSG